MQHAFTQRQTPHCNGSGPDKAVQTRMCLLRLKHLHCGAVDSRGGFVSACLHAPSYSKSKAKDRNTMKVAKTDSVTQVGKYFTGRHLGCDRASSLSGPSKVQTEGIPLISSFILCCYSICHQCSHSPFLASFQWPLSLQQLRAHPLQQLLQYLPVVTYMPSATPHPSYATPILPHLSSPSPATRTAIKWREIH